MISAISASEAMKTADSGQRNVDDEEEAVVDSDSSLESRNTRRTALLQIWCQEASYFWHTIQVMDCDAMNESEQS